MKRLAAALAVLLAAAIAPGSALADMRALVIGIDKYADKQELRGSVNDALDIAAVLRANDVADLTVLTDGGATKAAFDTAWGAVVARAQAGDLLFLSFSGHGIRLPEKPGSNRTPDGYEKGFLLQPYDSTDAPSEILRDEDLYDLFAAATARGLKIVFVADACHAGAAVRGTDPRAGGAPFRFQRFQTQAAPVAEPVVAGPVKARPANPAVTVFSATDERLSIQEVLIDGKYRGALSYALARGLEGPAGDADGLVSAAALRRYVSPMVRVLSGNRQIPHFTLPDRDLPLVSTRQGGAPAPGELAPIGVAVLGDAPPGLSLTGASIAADPANAELIWDSARRQLLSVGGDVLASGIGADKLQGAIDARRVLDALRRIMARQFGPVETTAAVDGGAAGEGAFFTRGMTVRFSTDPGDFRYVTMLDLNATGAVQFMWPLAEAGDPVEWPAGRPLSFTAPVTGPFGADFIVTLLSREPLTELHKALERAHNRVAPLDFYEAFREAYATTEVRVGIEGVYSCQSLRSNGQCDSMLASQP